MQEIADFFYNITRLDVDILDENDSVIAKIESISLPGPLRGRVEKEKNILINKVKTIKPGEYLQELVSVFHIYYLLVHSTNGYYAIIGPYVYKDVPNDIVHQIMRNFSIPASLFTEYSNLYRLFSLNVRPVHITGNLMLTLLSNGLIQGQLADSEKIMDLPAVPSHKYMESYALRNIDHQYAKEDRIRGAICKGNTKQALQALAANSNRFEYRSDGYSLWHIQHLVSVMGTIMRVAAREGGVPPHIIHEISNRYFHQIPKCKSEGELEALLPKMVKDYCHAVQFAKIVSYTPIVQAAVSFLHIYYKQNITIEKVAAYIPCHPNYLCHCFKKETGMTLIQMLSEIRLDYALTLLKNPSYPITQIASEVGFESYSHFSTIFKKKYGCSCSQWRKNAIKCP